MLRGEKADGFTWLPNGSFWQICFPFACAHMSAKHKNVVGPQVRKRRCSLDLRQSDLAARLQILGWEVDRAGVSKIEGQLIWVSDFQMMCLSEALSIAVADLLPKLDSSIRLRDNIAKLRTRKGAAANRFPPTVPPHCMANRERTEPKTSR